MELCFCPHDKQRKRRKDERLLCKRQNEKTESSIVIALCVAVLQVGFTLVKDPLLSWTEQCTCSMRVSVVSDDCTEVNSTSRLEAECR